MAGTTARQSAEQRLAEQQADRRRQRIILAVVVIGVVVVVVLAGIGYQSWKAGRMPHAPAAQPTFAAATITDGKPVVLGKDDAKVTLTLFEDFRCPHCADFNDTLGPTISRLQRDGTIKVELYPMSFVDVKHGSVSSANAFACAAEAGRGQQFYAGLFDNYGLQWNDKQLLALGRLVGLNDTDFVSCVRQSKHRAWVASINQAATQQKVDETPTVKVDGVVKPDAAEWSTDQLRAEIQAAQ